MVVYRKMNEEEKLSFDIVYRKNAPDGCVACPFWGICDDPPDYLYGGCSITGTVIKTDTDDQLHRMKNCPIKDPARVELDALAPMEEGGPPYEVERCTHCGEILGEDVDPGWKYCPYCGAYIGENGDD